VDCYHSIEKLSSSILLSKDTKINAYKDIILSIVVCETEILSLSLRRVQSRGLVNTVP
jgi:hypothetical protein